MFISQFLLIFSFFSGSLWANSAPTFRFLTLEQAVGGRLGVYAKNLRNNATLSYRENELFPMGATSKVMVVGALLHASDINSTLLGTRIFYTEEDLNRGGYSPKTSENLEKGMTLVELAGSSLSYNDNPAINLIVENLGGLEVVNSFARSLGDVNFRLDRQEPDLNSALPCDPRDTTTPRAMGISLEKLLFSRLLSPSARNLLIRWMVDNTRGDKRIRAGVPKTWRVADKTGTADYGTTNDIGVIWREDGSAIVLVVYYTQEAPQAPPKDRVIQEATEIVVDWFGGYSRSEGAGSYSGLGR